MDTKESRPSAQGGLAKRSPPLTGYKTAGYAFGLRFPNYGGQVG